MSNCLLHLTDVYRERVSVEEYQDEPMLGAVAINGYCQRLDDLLFLSFRDVRSSTRQSPISGLMTGLHRGLLTVGNVHDNLRRKLLGDANVHVAPSRTSGSLAERDRRPDGSPVRLSREDLEHMLCAPYTFPLVNHSLHDSVMSAFERVEELLPQNL